MQLAALKLVPLGLKLHFPATHLTYLDNEVPPMAEVSQRGPRSLCPIHKTWGEVAVPFGKCPYCL